MRQANAGSLQHRMAGEGRAVAVQGHGRWASVQGTPLAGHITVPQPCLTLPLLLFPTRDLPTKDLGVPNRTRLQLRDGQALVLLQKAALQQLGVHAWGKGHTHASSVSSVSSVSEGMLASGAGVAEKPHSSSSGYTPGGGAKSKHALVQWVKGCWREELGLRSSRAPAARVHACGQRGQGCILQASGCEFSVHACKMRSASLLYRTAPQTNVQVLCKAQRWAGWQLCGPHGLPKLQAVHAAQSHPPVMAATQPK